MQHTSARRAQFKSTKFFVLLLKHEKDVEQKTPRSENNPVFFLQAEQHMNDLELQHIP